MAAGVSVFRGVAIWGAVAAASSAAFLAGPQVDPSCADLHTLLAFVLFRMLYVID